MLGKERKNKWQPDEGFVDQSWENMKFLLDEEMPVIAKGAATGGKSYLLLALFLLIGFMAGAGSFFYYELQKETETQTPSVSPQIPIAQLNTLPDLPETTVEDSNLARPPQARSDIPTMLRESRQAMLKTTADASLSTNQTQSYDPTNTLNTSSSSNDNLQTLPSVITKEEEEAAKSNTLKGEETRSKEAAIALKQAAETKANTQQLLTPVTPVASLDASAIAFLPDHTMGTLVLPKDKARIGLIIAGHYNHLFKTSGFSFGVTAEKRLNPRFALRTGLQYAHFNNINENQTGAYSNFNAYDLDGSVNSPTLNQLEENYSTFQFPNMDYLSVPLMMVYSLSNELKVTTGLEFSYLFRTRFPDSPEGNDRGLSNEFLKLDGSAVEKGLRRGNMAARIGVGYTPGDNFGLDLSYNIGLLDYTKDDYFGVRQNDTHQFWKLAFSYYFSRN